MRRFIFVACALACLSVQAQSKKPLFGISLSLDYNSYSNVDSYDFLEYEGLANFSGGLVSRFFLTERVSLSTGLLYSTKNFVQKYDGMFRAIEGDDPIYIKDELTHSNSFIDLPIDFQFKVNQSKKVEILGAVGFVNSFQVAHKNEKLDGAWGKQDYKTYKDFILSSKFGIGLMFNLDKVGIYLEPQARFYLTKVHQNYPDDKPIHVGFAVQLFKL